MVEINGQFYADLDTIQAQMAAWLELHSPGSYRCLRCGDERWYIAAAYLVRSDQDYRIHLTPGTFTAIDIGCVACRRLETYDVSQLRLFP